ncbi:MAG: pseudaminic acid cytidylyltransferase [Methylococcaceae bacterium]|nr:pseudaminic acid cytidylyltransferase [Methylococcaceae bacterium]
MNICVIPARGGSKRIPGKNIKNFCGKPIIAWSIEIAKASGLFEHIMVSTDDPAIAKVATDWGAEVPFVRPAEIANDYAGTTEVIAHASQWALDQGWPVSAVCCIYATAPFIQIDDLKQGLVSLQSGDWSYAFSATDFASPIFRAFKRCEDGGIEMFFPDQFSTRSQDLPEALHDAGQFYWGKPSAWIEGQRIFDRYSVPVFIPRWRVQDIDDQDDWLRAEVIHKLLRQSNV